MDILLLSWEGAEGSGEYLAPLCEAFVSGVPFVFPGIGLGAGQFHGQVR